MGRQTKTADVLGTGQRWGGGPAYGPMLAEDRVAVFALDCPQALEWRNWRPGNEYEKMLVMKNVGTKALRIKYQLPASKYFSMEFPEPAKIGAGLSWAVKVVFRPVKLQMYEDELTFLMPNGSFVVPLIGRTPVLGIQVLPSEVQFGYMAVKESGDRTFEVQNTGDLPVLFKWRVEEPFSITPSRGQIPQGSLAQFAVSFAPKEASVFTANAVCVVEDGPSATLALHGIGKFPHIRLDLDSISFGELYTGHQAARRLSLANPSLVPANFQVRCVESTGPAPVCKVIPPRGCIQPGLHVDIDVVYSPNSTGTHTVDTFEIFTPGGNKVTLTAQGTAMATVVTPSANIINFGSIESGTQALRSMSLTNESDTPARYEFVNDALGVFSFGDAVRGVIPSLFTISVTIGFNPTAPSHHWKRVTLLVKNGEPLYVDLVGTAYSEKLRPPPLSNAHVEDYMRRVQEGGNPVRLEGTAPDSPSAKASQAQSRAQSAVPSMAPSEMLRAAVARPPSEGLSSWEQHFLGHDVSQPLAVDSQTVEFPACSRLRPADYKSVSVTNKTTAKLTIYPTVPGWQDPLAPPNAPPEEPVFKVFPDVTDVRPGETTTFRISFRPPRDGQYYSAVLDFVAHVKHMRSFRTVAEHNFNTPYNVAVTVLGNTFLHAPEEFSPKFELGASAVHFPPTRVGEAVHQTLELINKGDTAVMFDFQDKAVSDAFQVKPKAGRVGPHTTTLVALRFCPSAAQQYTRQLHCSINHNLKAAVPLQLIGAGYTPAIHFETPGSTMFFKPTCVGATSVRPLVVRNPSSIPVLFYWTIPRALKDVVGLSPMAGKIPGKGALEIQASFRPQKIKTYTSQAVCRIRGARDRESDAILANALAGIELEASSFDHALPLTIVGEGSNGAVTIDPPSLDLGVVLAGEMVGQQLTLLNHSMGVLRYRMELKALATDSIGPMPASPKSSPFNPTGNITSDSPDVSVDEPEGILYARTPKTVTLMMHPKIRGRQLYQVLLHTAAGEARDSLLVTAGGVPTATAEVGISAKFPLLQFTDVFSFDAPKLHLWQNLNLQVLNTELASALNNRELSILRAIAEGKEVPTKEILKALDPVELRFGAGAQGSNPAVVHFELSNTGDALPLSWSLTAQDSAGVEMENWVETTHPLNEAERNLHFIMEHRIFDFFPCRGTLQPCSSCRVTVAYKHIAPGVHILPLLLQIDQGKKVCVHLKGATVSPDVQALSWPLDHHTFLPVPIGDTEAPMQVVPLRNGGPAPVEYALDVSVLAGVTRANHNVEVLRLVGPPRGAIPPGRTALLNFVLQPVEAKEVVVDVPIAFSNGKGTSLCLMGRGFHPEQAAVDQEPLAGENLLDITTWESFHPEPHLHVPGAIGSLSTEAISLGSIPAIAVTRRLVVVSNLWDLPIRFKWDLDQLAHEAGCIDGVLEVQPPSGRLEVGERASCKLVFKSGLKAQVFQGEIRCRVEPTEDALEANAQILRGSRASGLQQLARSGETAGADTEPEEVLAVHPLPTAGRQSRKRPPGSQRLPLHLAMTQTAQLQKDRLAAAAAETMTKMQAAMEASAAPREAPAGHDLLLFVHGRVLSGPQLKAAACCVASEAEGAKAAHAGASWRVPTVEPLVKEPSGLFPPPAPGHSDKGQPWPDAEPGFAAAVSILTDVILDAVASPQLAAALRELEEEEIPRFAQVLDRPNEVIRKAGETEPAEPVEVAKPLAVLPPPIPAAESFAPPTDDSRANRAEGSHREGEGEEPAGDGELGDGAEEEERAALARVAHPEIQVFMEFVLENAIYGLIQESILDDWEPLGLEEDQEEEVRRGEDYEGPAWDSRGVRYA